MQGVSWLLAVLVLYTSGSGTDGQCWDFAGCADLDSTEKILECVWLCRNNKLVADAESLLSESERQNTAEEEEREDVGLLMSTLAYNNDVLQAKMSSSASLHNEDRRSYSMEHFRWGKPMGRKRRPVKVYAGGFLEEAGPEEAGPGEKSVESPYVPPPSRRQLDSPEQEPQLGKKNLKSSAEKYRMTHFRWSSPPATKRYGGFMKPYEQSSKPLITLLRNIIVKDGR